jgi:hypothetical protein
LRPGVGTLGADHDEDDENENEDHGPNQAQDKGLVSGSPARPAVGAAAAVRADTSSTDHVFLFHLEKELSHYPKWA